MDEALRQTDTGEPILYFDLASPYAYLAVMRAEGALGRPVTLEPILVGAIFNYRGSGSWALTDERETRVAEIEQRAQRYGLPPLEWPAQWPANSLLAMRAATWAKRVGRLDQFARAVFESEFGAGADIVEPDVIAACATAAGLDPDETLAATARQDVKDELKRATEAAWERGVQGVPSLAIGGEVMFGDDKLEAAAARLPRE